MEKIEDIQIWRESRKINEAKRHDVRLITDGIERQWTKREDGTNRQQFE